MNIQMRDLPFKIKRNSEVYKAIDTRSQRKLEIQISGVNQCG